MAPVVAASSDIEREPAYARALAAGRTAFGLAWRPTVQSVASGRIELLGNHLDYNGGPVLAAAIDRRVVVLLDEEGGDADAIHVCSPDTSSNTFALSPSGLGGWRNVGSPREPADYVRGLIAAAQSRQGHSLRRGVRLAFAGDVPIGFGVSSSAALCVALTLALVPGPLSFTEIVLLAQEAEHRAGTPCGTMDQSASVAGGVIRYDGATLTVEQLHPDLGGYVFVVADSGVDRALGASAYPTRVEEANRIRSLASSALGHLVEHPAQLDVAAFERLTTGTNPVLDPTLTARLRHVVTETERVAAGMTALREADWPRFGTLMTASGRSSAGDYDISHPKVEELVAEILRVDGVLGARMMGGGGGGTALTLMRRDRIEMLEAALRTGYYSRYGMKDRPGVIQPCAFAGPARVESVSSTTPAARVSTSV